jgi:mono/diheme cytochrome c family protein
LVASLSVPPGALAGQATTNDEGGDRVDDVLELDGDRSRGRIVFKQSAGPSCATCHVLGDVGARGGRGPNLDEMQPRTETVVRAIVGGEVEIHDRQGFADQLDDQQVADLATFVSEASVDPIARIDVREALGTSPWVGASLALATLVALTACWYVVRIVLEIVRRGRDA